MHTRKHVSLTPVVAMLAAIGWIADPGGALAAKPDPKLQQMTSEQMMAQKITPAQRQAAADRLKAAKAAAATTGIAATTALVTDPVTGSLIPDYFGTTPNWAFSPSMRKFVDALPDLKGLIAAPDVVTYPDSDYYEIELIEYNWPFHSDLLDGPTKLRGYRQTNMGTNTAGCAASGCTAADNTIVPKAQSYLGPVIVATKNRPTRIKFTNSLPVGASGNLFIPTDTTVMGAGMGPDGTNYPQNRGTLHLHGGFTPWVSDGTPHQWVTPTGETASLKTGLSTQGVPDMDLPSGNSMTFYWPNQQSGRIMFYHDHAYGITRLNVYAGEAAGYLLYDAAQEGMLGAAGVPGTISDLGHLHPLVIQDRTFVWGTPPVVCDGTPGTGTFATDPTWCDPTKPQWGKQFGNLWLPHVYMPNQNPWDVSGANAMGRWDYALWFWPPFTGLLNHGSMPNPYYGLPGEPAEIPGTPNPSIVPEAFMDTPVVNGKAYPTLTVDAAKYQFRILNASNDRFLNLSLFVAADKNTPTTAGTAGAVLCVDNSTVLPANCTEVKMVPFNTSQHAITPFPDWWYTPGINFTFDDRAGGVPDPTTRGPAMIQIGTEGGILPAPAVILNQPVNYTYNRKDIVVLNVQEHALFLGPAERADVVVDFTNFAGKTLILYNDSPAPVPAADQRLDYYTGAPDQTATGGAPSTLPGMGPNTRTIMQIVVNGAAAPGIMVDDYDPAYLASLSAPAPAAGLPAAFAASQDPIIVPQAAYNAAYGTATVDTPGSNVSRIADTSLTFTPLSGSPLTIAMGSKAIQELFELDYGRMNATLGVEVPFTNGGNQTTIPYGYIDPTTEFIAPSDTVAPPSLGDGTQIWKITHNGVDTHAIHFHLFNVQVINRVGWDGAIRNPDPNEAGWKETVRMNPLEDIIVAMRPTVPQLPFGLPDSIRPLDVTTPLGSTGQFSGQDPLGLPVNTVNALNNFNWEYVWHCHLLGHEENDMMRPIEFQVTSTIPAAPGTLAAVAGLPAPAVSLSWVDATPWSFATKTFPATTLGNKANEVGFTVQRSTASNFGANLKSFTVKANATSFADASTQSNTRYYYRVQAFNAAGASAWSNVVTLTTAAGSVPATPSGLSAAVISATQVRLSWTDNSTNETGFIVERDSGGGFVALSPIGAHASTGAMTFTDNTVATGVTYGYRVKAVNGATSSGYSNTASVTTSIAAPTNLNGALLSATSVRLTWTDNAINEANYKVERSGDGGANWQLLTALPGLPANTATYTDATVPVSPPGPSTYVYRVTAVNGATSSSSALATVGVAVPPAAPSNLLAAGVALNGNNRAVVLSWNDNSNNETGFTLQRCTGTTATTCGPAAAGWANVSTTIAANATTYQDNGVTRRTTYSYRIQSVNALGVSAWSAVATVTTP